MTAASVSVRVFPEAMARLTRSPSGDVMRFLHTVGGRVLNNSNTRVNVDTGYLRSTGVVEDDATASTVRVAYRAHYAVFVHEGTSHYPGNPFLTDAMQDEVSRL